MGADEDDMLYKQLREGIVLANCCSINFMLCACNEGSWRGNKGKASYIERSLVRG